MNITSSQAGSYLFSDVLSNLRSISPKDLHTSGVSADATLKSSASSNLSVQKVSSSLQTEQVQQSQAYQQAVSDLAARDQQVRLHEQAHLSASGGFATSGASFTYQVGADGKRYAVGGEVSLDISPITGNPEATIQKALVIQHAALAPTDPSAQDKSVYAQAVQMEVTARQELQRQKPGVSSVDSALSADALKKTAQKIKCQV